MYIRLHKIYYTPKRTYMKNDGKKIRKCYRKEEKQLHPSNL